LSFPLYLFPSVFFPPPLLCLSSSVPPMSLLSVSSRLSLSLCLFPSVSSPLSLLSVFSSLTVPVPDSGSRDRVVVLVGAGCWGNLRRDAGNLE
jgi:hypothetical protein